MQDVTEGFRVTAQGEQISQADRRYLALEFDGASGDLAAVQLAAELLRGAEAIRSGLVASRVLVVPIAGAVVLREDVGA